VVVNDVGAAVDGSGTDLTPAEEVVAEIKKKGGVAVPNYDSVAGWESSENIIKTCLDNFGKLDILVNVAGILRDRMIFNMSEKEWRDVMEVHLNGTFFCSRHACILMRQKRGGRIINFTSDAWRGTTGHCNYGAAKGGIVSLTRSIALEMGKYGVTCNAISPGAATRMTVNPEVARSMQIRAQRGLQMAATGQQEIPGPEFVPPIIVWLASDEAADINGQVFGARGSEVTIYTWPEPFRAIHKKEGKWTVEELRQLVPSILTKGIANPSPPEPPKEG
jgi:NAD(P)-dependent dehydrogenase (short-subunit alcohol dehydrogenase family)